MKNWFKCYGDTLRDTKDEWLLVNKTGEYEYRNPTSLYVHNWETFPTKERALDYRDNNIAKVEHKDWKLYQLFDEA